jgi:hypothetical protein
MRRIVRLNSFGELIVQSFGSSTGPFLGPKGQDHFWATKIFRWDLFGLGESIDIIVSPELPETSNLDAVPSTTAYYFPGTEAPRANHIMNIPLQTVHHIDTMSLHTKITVASQDPMGTLLSHRVTPTLPPRYRVLNASIPIPTHITYENPGGPSSSGHSPHSFIPTLPQPPFRGPFPSSIEGTNPRGTIPLFTPNYQIPIGGQFHQGGPTHPPPL